jgi:energy-coupling factor transporter ATP-binding protein EcfA2
MIKRLELPDFGKFRKAGLDFGPFTVITGPNEAGKTTVFDALFDALCAQSRHEGRPLWKNLAHRYTALRSSSVVWEEGATPLAFGDYEFVEIFAIRGGELAAHHPENNGVSAWAQAAENALLNAGLNPAQLGAELKEKAESGRKGSVQAGIKRLREEIKDHGQAITALKSERAAVLSDAAEGPRLEAAKKEKEAALAAKHAEVKARQEALELLTAGMRRAVVMAGITALRELDEARHAAAQLKAFAGAAGELPKYRALQGARQDAEKRAAAAEAALAEKQAALGAAVAAAQQLDELELRLKKGNDAAPALAGRLGTFASAPKKIIFGVNKDVRYGMWAGGAALALLVAFTGRNISAYVSAAVMAGAAVWAGMKLSVTQTPVDRTPEEIKAFLTGLAKDWEEFSKEPLPTLDLEAARAFLARAQADYDAAVKASQAKTGELGALKGAEAAAAQNREELLHAADAARHAAEDWIKARGCSGEDDYLAKAAEYKKLADRAADREQGVLALAGGLGCVGENEFKDKLFAENGELERRGIAPKPGADAELARLKHELAALNAEARELEAALAKATAALQTNLAVSGARLGGLPERLNQAEAGLELEKEELAELELQAEAYKMASEVFEDLAETSALAFQTLGEEVTGTLRAVLPEAHAEFKGFEAAGAAVTDAGGVTRPVRTLSSGMRDLFMLAARLTIARRARLGPDGLAPAMLVLDEPFYTLDAARERAAIKLLANFHKDTGWQIIILTKDLALAASAKEEGIPVTEVPLAG